MVKELVVYGLIGVAVRLAVALGNGAAGFPPPVSASDRFWLRTGYVLGVVLWPLLVIAALAQILAVARHGPKGGA